MESQPEKLSVPDLINVLSNDLQKSTPQNQKTKRVGSLKLILSMMYGGKTSYLIHIIETLGRACKILYINHSSDKRSEDAYSTHSMSLSKSLSTKLNTTMIKIDELSKVKRELLLEHPVVCIDESQFFPDLDQEVRYMVNVLGLEVYVGSLNGDSNRKKFGQTLDLIPDCDDVIMLRDTICSRCALLGERNIALFTWRINDSSEQIEIGASNYIPVCRGCHNYLHHERHQQKKVIPDPKRFVVVPFSHEFD